MYLNIAKGINRVSLIPRSYASVFISLNLEVAVTKKKRKKGEVLAKKEREIELQHQLQKSFGRNVLVAMEEIHEEKFLYEHPPFNIFRMFKHVICLGNLLLKMNLIKQDKVKKS